MPSDEKRHPGVKGNPRRAHRDRAGFPRRRFESSPCSRATLFPILPPVHAQPFTGNCGRARRPAL